MVPVDTMKNLLCFSFFLLSRENFRVNVSFFVFRTLFILLFCYHNDKHLARYAHIYIYTLFLLRISLFIDSIVPFACVGSNYCYIRSHIFLMKCFLNNKCVFHAIAAIAFFSFFDLFRASIDEEEKKKNRMEQ